MSQTRESRQLLAIPEDCVCPITQLLMVDPVVCADGHTYEREAIERWIQRPGRRATSPKTNLALGHTTLIPNLALRGVIADLQRRMPLVQQRLLEEQRKQIDYEGIMQVVARDQAEMLAKATGGLDARLDRVLAKADRSGMLKGLRQRDVLFDLQSLPASSPVVQEMHGGRPSNTCRGWLRCSVRSTDAILEQCADWCVGYHGTAPGDIARILLFGLQRPGTDGVQVRHGQDNSKSRRSIYLSPSAEIAGFPLYASFFGTGDDEDDESWAQMVLECRVRPGSFVEKDDTISEESRFPWRNLFFDIRCIDPYVDMVATPGREYLRTEWLVENPRDIVVTGLMVREFGHRADPVLYGRLAHEVGRHPRWPWPEEHYLDLRLIIDVD